MRRKSRFSPGSFLNDPWHMLRVEQTRLQAERDKQLERDRIEVREEMIYQDKMEGMLNKQIAQLYGVHRCTVTAIVLRVAERHDIMGV